ncbi:SDR family oxidoreductase [Planctomycetota bacterium]|nr:SDR family oxidoreductase [Planctomycetota bacterium]
MANGRLILENKCFVIIGGTTGLGLSGAAALIRKGAYVVVVGRRESSAESAKQQLGDRCITVVGDAIDPATSNRAIDVALRLAGQLDGLYHVAGGSGRKFGDGPLHDVTDEGIEVTLDLNLKSMMLSNRAAINQFRKQGHGGVILNMGSVLGYSPSPRYFSTHVYAATKSAIIGFAKSLAAYYAHEDIRCNVIAPALVETPMAGRAASDDEILRFIKTKQPLDGGRIGKAEDLDDAVVYLMSDGSKYVTGQVLAVDGGWSVSEGQICEEVSHVRS